MNAPLWLRLGGDRSGENIFARKRKSLKKKIDIIIAFDYYSFRQAAVTPRETMEEIMNTEQMDKVVKATVDNLSISEGMALNLDLREDAINEAVSLGYVERRGNYLYPTSEGAEYRQSID